MSRPKKTATPPAPPPLTYRENKRLATEREARHQRIDAFAANMVRVATEAAPAWDGRVCHTTDHEVRVMFGPETPHTALCMSNPGLAECELRVDWSGLVDGTPPRVEIRFASYSTSGNTSADEAEAQGLALIAAARFARCVVAAMEAV